MTEATGSRDTLGTDYERWWAPVLAPSARGLLDRLDPIVAAGARDVIDIGIGTGNLSIPALDRWRSVSITAIDASSEMIDTAASLVHERIPGARDRFSSQVAFADALPFGDGTFDLAMSSFVLQLVPSRPRALREIRRVLRPGATLGYVTWIDDREPFPPDRVFDTLLAEFGFDDEPDRGRSGDVPSIERAVHELRRAGFGDVVATGATLEHAFTVDGYIAFLVEYDETSTFEELDRAERRRFLARLRDGLMRLREDELVFRAPIVYATGRRTDG